MTRTMQAALGLLVFMAIAFGGGYVLGRRDVPTPKTVEIVKEIAAHAETVYVRDTLRYTQWRTQYDTVRSVLNIHDTTEVVRYVKVADSTIAACTRALASCQHALSATKVVVSVQHAQSPSRLRVWGERALWLGVGYGVARITPSH